MIPVYEPVIGQEEMMAVLDALRSNEISGSFGYYLERFEKEFAAYCGCRYGIATTSGTTALQLAVAAAGIGPNDEVLVSAFTNIASVLAIVHCGATPVVVDSEPETWNMNVNLLEETITPRTKAIIPVHIYGHPVDMDPVVAVARKHGLIVIEDAAEAHGAEYKGRKVGGIGDMGCFSFYANKIITTGEGGMIVTNNDMFAEKARLLRNLAFTTPRFKHYELGFQFRMTNYQAAMGLAQLRKIEQIIDRKRQIAHIYNQHLKGLPGLQLPVEKLWAKNVYWVYGIVIHPEFGITRDGLIEALKEKGIDSRTFFCPMNLQPCLNERGFMVGVVCPTAEKLWSNGLYLPSSINLTEDQIAYISDSIKEIHHKSK